MNRKKTLLSVLLLLIVLLPLLVLPVNGGGWATVGITKMPEQLYAGRPFTIEFMVWQHGNKPVHELNWGNDRSTPIEPVISFGSADAGAKMMFEARPANKPGLFTAEISLPGDGEWFLSIDPNPLGGVTEFDPLTVLPESAAPATGATLFGRSITPMLNNMTAVISFTAVFLLAMLVLAYRSFQGREVN
jgi:hypothetical protein